MSKQIYLDYAASTPLDPNVLAAMQPYFSEKFYNPSATYLAARSVRQDLNEARASIAHWLGAKPAEIYFTAGATEANNLAITGIMSQFPYSDALVSSIEHDSVIAPAGQFNSNKIACTSEGVIDLKDLEKKITSRTVLISVMLVNNELGTIQPIREVASLISKVRKNRLKTSNNVPLYLHTDAAQAANYLDLHVARLGVDLMSINGGKIYGPKQTGVLFVKAPIVLKSLIVGGGQEHNLRSGTENVPGFIGLAKALEISQQIHEKETDRLRGLREVLIGELAKNILNTQINGSPKHQSPHILHMTFPGADNERLMMELDERGVQVAVGSACSAASTEPSHVLRAIGMSDDLARSSLRFSFGRQTTQKDVLKTAQLLKDLLTAKDR
jgi:cysteine desulfurase